MRTLPAGILLLIVFGLFLIVSNMDYQDQKMEREQKDAAHRHALQSRIEQKKHEEYLKFIVSYDKMRHEQN